MQDMRSDKLILILLLLVFAGCKKLDQMPEDTATKDVLFDRTQGLELYSNSFYDVLPTAGDIIRGDAMADYSVRSQVPDFLVPGAFGPRQSDGWDWGKLRNINYFLENNKSSMFSESDRNHYNGLARFFRAWFYFDKVKRFGDVPWINKTFKVDDPDLTAHRDSRTLVMDSIRADLQFAANNIKTTVDKTGSLITKNTVWAFWSRVALFEGTFRKYHPAGSYKDTENKWLEDAAMAAQKVMTSGTFSLNMSGGTDMAYRQLFISDAPVTTEVILSNVMNASLNVLNDANWWWTSATYGSRVSFGRNFVNTYLNIDGTPFTSRPGYQTMTFMEEVKGRDKRLQQTIRMGNYKRLNGGKQEAAPPVFSYTYTGYQPIKWALDDVYYDGGTRNTNSVCIIRYAEVLLNYAEARAELGLITDADWAMTVGALRRRAGITGNTEVLPTLADPYLTSKYFKLESPALLEVRRERGIELAFEGFRFYDIVRWHAGELMEMEWNGFYVPELDKAMDLNEDGVADVIFTQHVPADKDKVSGVTYVNVAPALPGGSANPQQLSNGTYGELTWLKNARREWEEKHYLYPIPEKDRLKNENLGQNPEW